KKIILCMALFSLLLCGQAMAERHVFDSKSGKFSVDVPEDWTANVIREGCKLDAKDGKNSLSIQFLPANNMPPQALANELAKHLKMSVKNETNEANGILLDGEMDGFPACILAVKADSDMIVSFLAGPDRTTMKQIYGTTKRVSDEENFFELDAGPIWNNDHAKTRCPEVLNSWLKENPAKKAEWPGDWTTTVEGQNSVCRFRLKN
ncbi:MAG: mannan-binding lectin, partial [Desulfovibrio sp.]|nr:mannan-binding lectin [Desulfovibrio sp.]